MIPRPSLLLLVSVFCLTAGEIEAQKSGWNLTPNTQYHIQTDEGPERYFRFQTLNGQYRKEKRLADGTVIGTEGWLDPLGYLRIKDYIADGQGYRILRSKMVYVGKDKPIQDAVSISKKVPAQSGILAKPRRPANPFRQPELKELSGNGIDANASPPSSSPTSAPISPGIQYQLPITTPAPTTQPPNLYSTPNSPYNRNAPFQHLEDGYSQPNTNYLPGYQFENPKYITPYQNSYSHGLLPPPASPSLVFQQPLNFGERFPQRAQQFPSRVNNFQGYQTPAFQNIRDPAVHQEPQGVPGGTQSFGRIVQASDRAGGPVQQRVGEFPEYDGTHTVKDGFQYYLKTHYHEEQNQPKEEEKIGSFGYIDPFGIRRVVYYKADAEHGFVHKKNNRYVGFNATPYDPQLPTSS